MSMARSWWAESLLETMGAAHSRWVCILRLATCMAPVGLSTNASGVGRSDAQATVSATPTGCTSKMQPAACGRLDQRWSGVVNVVNNEPIQLADLINSSLQRQGLAALTWDGEACVGGNDAVSQTADFRDWATNSSTRRSAIRVMYWLTARCPDHHTTHASRTGFMLSSSSRAALQRCAAPRRSA